MYNFCIILGKAISNNDIKFDKDLEKYKISKSDGFYINFSYKNDLKIIEESTGEKTYSIKIKKSFFLFIQKFEIRVVSSETVKEIKEDRNIEDSCYKRKAHRINMPFT